MNRRFSLLVVIVSALILLFQTLSLMRTNPQFALYGDWPGHFDKAEKLDWPWKSGWDTSFWGGYPTVTYPILSHMVIRSVFTITKSEYMTAAIVALLAILLQMIGLAALSKKVAPKKPFFQALFIITSVSLTSPSPLPIIFIHHDHPCEVHLTNNEPI